MAIKEVHYREALKGIPSDCIYFHLSFWSLMLTLTTTMPWEPVNHPITCSCTLYMSYFSFACLLVCVCQYLDGGEVLYLHILGGLLLSGAQLGPQAKVYKLLTHSLVIARVPYSR